MGDEEHGEAFRGASAERLEQAVARGDIERSGRLIENEQARLEEQRARDHRGLARAEIQVGDAAREIGQRIAEKLAEHGLALRALPRRIDATAKQAVLPEPEIVDER